MKDRVLRAALAAAILVAAIWPRPTTAEAGANDAGALLAKHKAFVGWAIGDGVVKTLRAEGRGVRDGKTTATLTELRYGIAYRETYQDSNGTGFNDGFTGSVFWTSNENGFTVRGIGEIVRYLADEQALFGERISDSPGTVVRREAVDGVDAVLVHVTPQVGFPMNVWIDPVSGAYKRVVIALTASTSRRSTDSATRRRPENTS